MWAFMYGCEINEYKQNMLRFTPHTRFRSQLLKESGIHNLLIKTGQQYAHYLFKLFIYNYVVKYVCM